MAMVTRVRGTARCLHMSLSLRSACSGFRSGLVSRRQFPSIWEWAWRRRSNKRLFGAGLLLVGCAVGGVNMVLAGGVRDQLPSIVGHVDALYEENKWTEALEYLQQFSQWEEAEVLWRLARLCYKVGKYYSSSKEESHKLANEGLTFAERSVAADPASFACHKWIGIVLSWASEFEGYKKKIEQSYNIRDHFLRAIELNPKDATCRHLLGQWCYSVSSVPWYQQKVAAVIFATPPSSSYEEALHHFVEAEKVDPGFYSTNWLFMGKCHQQLGNKEEARKWLTMAAEYGSERADDIEAKKEAETLLKKL